MTPEFANLVNPTFQHVLGLVDRINRAQTVDLAAEYAVIRRELEDAEMTASNPTCPVKLEEFQLAKQGLVYWIDEVLILADRKWMNKTLEWSYYETNDRAWKFYVDGEQRARRSSADVIEVWYLALVLGFQGDIQNAFHQQMNDPLPPDTTPEAFRKKWAAGLEKQIRQNQLPKLGGESLEGDARPMLGGGQLASSARWAAALFVVFIVLLVINFWM